MHTQEKLIAIVEKLGVLFKDISNYNNSASNTTEKADYLINTDSLIKQMEVLNSWFTPDNTIFQFQHWGSLLSRKNLNNWTANFEQINESKKVGLIMAGNIPMVGLHDLLAVYLSGNIAYVKPSSKDSVSIKYVADFLNNQSDEPRIVIVDKMPKVDAIIATGSNNSARYFNYYFKDIPHIIRQNRTALAILNGQETAQELNKFGNDLFRYFGLGCRNVSHILIPKGFNFDILHEAFEPWKELIKHNKYANNLNYYRTIMALEGKSFLDFGYCSFLESDSLFSNLSVINYHFYNNLDEVKSFIKEKQNSIQCVVSNFYPEAIPLGYSQLPDLNDYADGINVVDFLNSLKN